jgi:tetratricopeptide (TPR) repeat protein
MAPLKSKTGKISFFLVIIFLLAVGLRFYHLGSRPLYQDEHFNTVEVAAQPLSFIISTNLGSILYPLLLHFILPLGDIAFMARLPAALFGLLSVWMIYLIGRIIFSKKEALLAAFLSGTAAHFIYFSQQARGYSGLLFFALCSLYFFLRSLKKGNLLRWASYIFFTAVAIYMYFFALIIIPAQIFFVVVCLVEQWITRKKPGAFVLSKKQFLCFSLSLVSIGVMTFLLYSPVQHAVRYVDLKFMIRESIAGLFKGGLTLNPLSFVADTLKRQMDYSSSPALFFGKLAFVLLGILACLKSKRRELVLLLAVIILPLSMFILSNPPVIYIPADNKFIFIPAVLFLLMAKGVTGLASAMADGLSKAAKIKNKVRLGNAVLAVFVILLLVEEGLAFRAYNLTMGNLRSLHRGREISAGLKENIQNEEMVFADSPVAQLNFLSARPVVYPDGKKRGVMIYEQGATISRETATSAMGLWVIVSRARLDEKSIAEWAIPADEMEMKNYSRSSLLHWNRPDQPLWDKLVRAARLLLRYSNGPQEETSYRLFIAKVYLSAGKNREALEELADIDRTSAGSPLPRPVHGDKVFEILEKSSYQSIVVQLLENADRAALEGMDDDALSLQKEAENLSAFNVELRPRICFSLGETYLRKGMRDEARQKFFQALVLSRNQKEEDLLVKKIGQLFSFPFGYIVWRQEGFWHLRWWSDQRRTFSGEITSSPPSKKMKKLRWAKDDFASFFGNKLVFRGVSDKGRIKGFDLKARSGSSPTFLLTIDGIKNVAEKIIIAAKGGHPSSVPFSLD